MRTRRWPDGHRGPPPKFNGTRDILPPTPDHQCVGLLPPPRPRRHRILMIFGRDPPVEHEPQPAATRLPRLAAPGALRPRRQHVPARTGRPPRKGCHHRPASLTTTAQLWRHTQLPTHSRTNIQKPARLPNDAGESTACLPTATTDRTRRAAVITNGPLPGKSATDDHKDDPAIITERVRISGRSAANPLPSCRLGTRLDAGASAPLRPQISRFGVLPAQAGRSA